MTVEWRPRESDSHTVRRPSPTDCACRDPGPTPLSQPSDVFPARAWSKAPHSRHLVHSTALQNTALFGILGVLDIPRACWPKHELSEKPTFQLMTSCSTMRGYLPEESASNVSAAPPRLAREGAFKMVSVKTSHLLPAHQIHPYLHPCAAHADHASVPG